MKLYHLVEWYGFGIASATDIWQPIDRDHWFSMSAKFFEKVLFLTPWHVHARVRIRRWEMLVFRKILGTYEMNHSISSFDICYNEKQHQWLENEENNQQKSSC